MIKKTYSKDVLVALGPHEFRRSVQRLMQSAGFDAFSVDGPHDGGADIIADRGDERWVIQCKWLKSGVVGVSALDGLEDARIEFGGHIAVLATNQTFSRDLFTRRDRLSSIGIQIYLWSGDDLRSIAAGAGDNSVISLRPYQEDAVSAVWSDLNQQKKSLLCMATGLGKTVVVGETIRRVIAEKPNAFIVVIAHMITLVEQLQRALWKHIPLDVPTMLVTQHNRPEDLFGVVVGTNLSLVAHFRAGIRPDLVVVDEAHHMGSDNVLRECLDLSRSSWKLGVTATPWRSDGVAIQDVFGSSSFRVSIEMGMALGYLANVDYRLYCDNIDWKLVENISEYNYSVRELNRRLFIPFRDEQILEEVFQVWIQTRSPRGIVFAQSIRHAEQLCRIARGFDCWRSSQVLHSELSRHQRISTLLNFRTGAVNLLVVVDVLNEGIDVPEVNVVVFARVTHSRRIFVQQLGRGLRLSPGKRTVTVLDFAADARRLAAVQEFNDALVANGAYERLEDVPRVSFSDIRVEGLMREWLKDIATLADSDTNATLQFPPI